MSSGNATQIGYSAPNSSEEYIIDASASQLRIHAFADGIVAAIAHSPKFDVRHWVGVTRLNADAVDHGPLRITIDTSGIELVDSVRESDRTEIYRVLHHDVLRSQQYPEIVFDGNWRLQSSVGPGLYDVAVTGSLRLCGGMHQESFDARVNIGVDTFRAHGKFLLFQRDYGIEPPTIAKSMLRVRNELTLSFFIVARKRS